jgi:hypothetical protein
MFTVLCFLTLQLTRLENGLALLRVIVDAKNDTLVLIRGKVDFFTLSFPHWLS